MRIRPLFEEASDLAAKRRAREMAEEYARVRLHLGAEWNPAAMLALFLAEDRRRESDISRAASEVKP